MVLLALDTSSLTMSLALLGADRSVIEHVVEGPPKRQSELLPGAIAHLLSRHQVEWGQLTALIVGLGPGSFTGLRIGLATMKGLAYSRQRPLIGVSSLAGLAWQCGEGLEVWPAALVKRGDLYFGRFRKQAGQLETLEAEGWLPAVRLAERLRHSPQAVLVGPIVAEYRPHFLAAGVAPNQLLDEPAYTSAVALAHLAPLPATYEPSSLFALEPHYLRGSGAEENPKFPPLPGAEPKARMKDE